MKNKNIILAIIILIVAVLILIGFFVFRQNKPESIDQNEISPNNQENIEEGDSSNTEQTENKLVTNDFSLNLPAGWIKTDAIEGITAMAVNSKENITDPAAKAINFKSYVAVSKDALGGKSLKEYMQAVKDGLGKTISNIIFSNEKELVINESSAYAIEAELIQQNVNFKVLIVVIQGKGDDVWVISFNTTASDWAGYTETFSNIANSFILKK